MSRQEKVAELDFNNLVKLRHKHLVCARTDRNIGKRVQAFKSVDTEVSNMRSQYPHIKHTINLTDREIQVWNQYEKEGLQVINEYLSSKR